MSLFSDDESVKGGISEDFLLVDVALPVPLFQTFTYKLPRNRFPNAVGVGSRVVVPFRQKKMIGIVLRLNVEKPEKGQLKNVIEVPDADPCMSAEMLQLCKWIGDYYVVPLGIAIKTALPAVLTGASKPTPHRKTRKLVTIADDLPSLLQREKVFTRAPKQRVVFELLESLGGTSSVEHLKEQLGVSSAILKALLDRGFITMESEEVHRDPFKARAKQVEHRHNPTDAQLSAINQLKSGKKGDVFLLHGITGSGKTLVYIELLRTIVFERNQSAIVLVPEIALTPQTVDRFRSVFGDSVAVLHSALSDGERYDAWLALKRGEKKIAVGARSALFAPVHNLGAIIIDEEHETSYKQGESPRYHARETAILRAKLEGGVVVLGSATPSVESWVNAQSGKYTLLTLPARVGGGNLPTVEVVDLRKILLDSKIAFDVYRRTITDSLTDAIEECLSKKQQAILLLNRRGYSAFIQCDSCGNVEVCPNCSISLTYHRSPERLVCHYCMYTEQYHTSCRQCDGPIVQQRGLGTQQVERLLGERFPGARIARMDVDTTTGKWAHADILDRVASKEVDILLGTQMIAKGLDFPNVTLVGVVDADIGINLPDFRANERCFQLLSQVSGRAGRGPLGGRVIIQTRNPDNHAVKFAITHDYLSFVETELNTRKSPEYPPENRLTSIVFSGLSDEGAAALAADATDWLRRLVAKSKAKGLTVIGPAKRPIERIKTRWRWHTLIKATNAQELNLVAHYFMERYQVPKNGHQLRITLDRDPVTLL